MEFSTAAFSIVCILYPIIYAVLFVHDIYFVKDAEDLIPKPEEQDVDISDEAGQFQPILIDKDAPPKSVKPLQKVKEEKPNSTETTGQSIVSASKKRTKVRTRLRTVKIRQEMDLTSQRHPLLKPTAFQSQWQLT